jgi:hypothetical protein
LTSNAGEGVDDPSAFYHESQILMVAARAKKGTPAQKFGRIFALYMDPGTPQGVGDNAERIDGHLAQAQW